MKRKLIATLLRASGIAAESPQRSEDLQRKARPDAQINKNNNLKHKIMAKRIFKAQLKPCTCVHNPLIDHICTKPGLALTPSDIKALTDKGIAVSLPNAQNFLAPQEGASWSVEPQFRRDATMCSVWETEKLSQRRVMKAKKTDVQLYGD